MTQRLLQKKKQQKKRKTTKEQQDKTEHGQKRRLKKRTSNGLWGVQVTFEFHIIASSSISYQS